MRHAFIILAYNEWDVLKKTLAYLNHQECDLYLNIDCTTSSMSKVSLLLSNYSNIKYCSYTKLHWGGYSILRTEINLLNIAINSSNADYFHILSGQDYPIKPYTDFIKFFEERPFQSYFECRVATFREIDQRLLYFMPYDYYQARNPKRFHLTTFLRGFQQKHQIKRTTSFFPDRIYLGSQWCSMTREACAFLLAYTKQHPGFFKRLNHTFAPEEIYMHTILLNYYQEDKICTNNNLRFIRWQKENGNLPANLGEEHFKFLVDKKHFFARKMQLPISTTLIHNIDTYLLEHHEDYASCFDYDSRIAEGLVKMAKALAISSALIVGDNLIYLDALLGMGVLANGICNNQKAYDMAEKMSIANFCQLVEWTKPIHMEDEDRYDTLLFVNQISGKMMTANCMEVLSELTSHYMVFVEENMADPLQDKLETLLNTPQLKISREFSLLLKTYFEHNDILQICVLIKTE